MGASMGWHEFVGSEGALVTIDRFGASAPASTVAKEYGFTPENVANQFKRLKSLKQHI
jgi:transketolase